MEELSPAYLSSMASQLGALSAFLGGFAATFLATLLTLGHRGRLMTVTIGMAAVSSVGFIVAVVAATMLTATLHPNAPAALASAPTTMPRTIMSLSFGIATLALLAGLGCSGWTRSRTVGWITTAASAVGIMLVLMLTVRVG